MQHNPQEKLLRNFARFLAANGVRTPWFPTVSLGLVAFCLACAVPAFTQNSVPNSPPAGQALSGPSGEVSDLPEEMRGLWVVRDSLMSPQSVHQVVQTAVKYHLNALFVQVRGRGDALYNSPFEPRSEILAHQPKSFDPLEQIVVEGHAAGLQVHAWLNTYLTWSGNRAPYSGQHLWNAHRNWFACDRKGNCSCAGNDRVEGAFLQPSNPQVQQHLFSVFTDVASRYDVDGIHFDYCRYAGTDYDFSGSTLQRFRDFKAQQLPDDKAARFDMRLKSDRLAYVHAFPQDWADWRRAQITTLVARISHKVKEDKPWMQVSAAVFPDPKEAFAVRGQDWEGWLQNGYLDAVALMSYDRNTERVLAQTRHAIAIAGERQVYTGIGAWRLQAHDVAGKISALRRTGAAGVNLFSYGGVHNRPRYLDTLVRGVFASRAAPPRMRWLPKRDGTQEKSRF
jgi:uncharacterized lipoprotein YddW (UPF0748 family)